MEPVLQLEHITKTFPGVKALSDVHFDVRAGEVHALLGENGAHPAATWVCRAPASRSVV